MDQNDEENQIEDDEPKSLPHKALLLLVGLLVAVFVFHYGVKTFRNTNYRDLSERFIRSNTFIKTEVGDIARISGAQAFKNGDGSWEVTRTVGGSQKKLLVTVVIYCNEGSADPGVGCTVKYATYKGDGPSEDAREVPTNWYDNFLIVYQ